MPNRKAEGIRPKAEGTASLTLTLSRRERGFKSRMPNKGVGVYLLR
jgi:hypothetical protein